MFEVIYFSRGGNTKRIAEAMAEELGVKAEDVRNKKGIYKDSIIFLGSGLYGGRIGREMDDFIRKNDFRGRKVAVFETSGSGEGHGADMISEKLREKGAKIEGKFACRGKFFLLFNRGHPSGEELNKARMFAHGLKENV